MRVFVKQASNAPLLVLEVDGSTTVSETKRTIERMSGLPEEVQKLVFAGRVLDGGTLGDSFVTKDSTIVVYSTQEAGVGHTMHDQGERSSMATNYTAKDRTATNDTATNYTATNYTATNYTATNYTAAQYTAKNYTAANYTAPEYKVAHASEVEITNGVLGTRKGE